MMVVRAANALIVAIVVYLLLWIVLPLVGIPMVPYAVILAVLAGVVTFFSGHLVHAT